MCGCTAVPFNGQHMSSSASTISIVHMTSTTTHQSPPSPLLSKLCHKNGQGWKRWPSHWICLRSNPNIEDEQGVQHENCDLHLHMEWPNHWICLRSKPNIKYEQGVQHESCDLHLHMECSLAPSMDQSPICIPFVQHPYDKHHPQAAPSLSFWAVPIAQKWVLENSSNIRNVSCPRKVGWRVLGAITLCLRILAL